MRAARAAELAARLRSSARDPRGDRFQAWIRGRCLPLCGNRARTGPARGKLNRGRATAVAQCPRRGLFAFENTQALGMSIFVTLRGRNL